MAATAQALTTMASFVGDHVETGASIALVRSGLPLRRPTAMAATRLERLHARLAEGALERRRAAARRRRTHARHPASCAAAGGSDAADALAAGVYASDVIVALAAEGELEAADTRVAASALARGARRAVRRRGVRPLSCGRSPARRCSSCRRSSPPRSSSGCSSTSTSRSRRPSGVASAAPGSNASSPSAPTTRHDRIRANSQGCDHRPQRPVARRPLQPARRRRFGASASPSARSSIRVFGDPRRDVSAYLDEAAAALSPVLERELLLERNAARESALVASSEKRLHAARLRPPRRPDPGRPRARRARRSSCATRSTRSCSNRIASSPTAASTTCSARLADLDRGLRELAHSLETKSIVSRPLSEIVHREVDAFAERSGIEATVEVRGDPESLSSAQRIAVFRAVQESLANVREHSGATAVEVRIRARRSTIDVQRHRQRPRIRGVARARARRRSAAGSASSGWASASACSAAPSRSTAGPAARRRCGSRCRAGSR